MLRHTFHWAFPKLLIYLGLVLAAGSWADGAEPPAPERRIPPETVITPLRPQLDALARKGDLDEFASVGGRLIRDGIYARAFDLAVVQDGEENMNTTELALALGTAQKFRAEQLTKLGKKDEHELTRDEARELNDATRKLLESIMARSVQARLARDERMKVTDGQIEQHIREHPDEYGGVTRRRVHMMKASSEEQADRLDDALAKRGFIDAAASQDNEYKRDSAGLFGDLTGEAPFAVAELNAAIKDIAKGQFSKRLKVNGTYYWLFVAERIEAEEITGETRELVRKKLFSLQWQIVQQEYSSRIRAGLDADKLERLAQPVIEAVARAYDSLPGDESTRLRALKRVVRFGTPSKFGIARFDQTTETEASSPKPPTPSETPPCPQPSAQP